MYCAVIFNHYNGLSDDSKTVYIWGSNLSNYSGRGPTTDCVFKPDILAPGGNIISCLSKTCKPDMSNVIENDYVKMSGTSMSTPVISGTIALLLEKYPNLKPNDVKYMLKLCAEKLNYPRNQQGWGLVNTKKLFEQEAVDVGYNRDQKNVTEPGGN